MIYTVTFNPSLDYLMEVDQFQVGQINSMSSECIRAGGKGINVSIVLTSMGIPNVALGFIAGFTGDYIQKGMEERGCTTEFVKLPEGFSRVNVKLSSGIETEINGKGPVVTKNDFDRMMSRISTMKAGDTLVLGGSVPASLPKDVYEQMLDHIDTAKINVVVDTNSFLMRRTLPYRPFLIKTNLKDMSEMFGRQQVTELDDIVSCARHLQEEGARNVFVSMGGEGAVLVTEDDHVFVAPAPDGNVTETIGTGDAMIAGFLAGYTETGSYVDGFRKGIAAGSATAFTSGLATADKITATFQRV